ncbi:MAG: AraC family transcriptional regulator [Chthoniobacterales bacterium]
MNLTLAKSPEAQLWNEVDGEWRPLFGSFADMGVSMEWHDFDCESSLNWSESFHPHSLEICLNLSGCGSVNSGKVRKLINPKTVSYYFPGSGNLVADRHAGQRHKFLTVELSPKWLSENTRGVENKLSTDAKRFLNGGRATLDAKTTPLNSRLQSTVHDICHPTGAESTMWMQAKVLEIVSQTLFAPRQDELFCVRQKRIAEDRIGKVKALLFANIEIPPTLTELGKQIGCSPFYLCRIFSQNTGQTISQYLRQLRMEEAARLLKSGKCNVTETALRVGYSSLSHFSKTFSETFGRCPCGYIEKLAFATSGRRSSRARMTA